jgi:sugar lactone lactonase YvrE
MPVLSLLMLLLGLQAPGPAPAAKSNAALLKEAREAHNRGENAAFLASYEELARRRPGEIFTLYNLARGQALNGQTETALATLEQILTLRVASDLELDKDFESIRRTEGYRSVLDRMNAFRKERVSSGATRAFAISDKGFIAEGVAYDPVTKAFFVSSIRHRKIVRIDRSGKITDFVTAGRDGLRSALGMRVDPKRRTLWVASQAVRSMDGYQKDQPHAAAVFEYDVDSGRLRKEHVPQADGEPAGFDDLTVAPDGTVFVNDAASSRIRRISPGGPLEVFLVSDVMGGTQGLAVSGDGKILYASDYRGLFAVDIASKRMTPIRVPPDLALTGIDGLVLTGRSLIAIQNGIIPHRVIRLDLAPDGQTISKSRILEMNHPDFDEPTLGTVVDGVLYFSADSQGQKFLNEKKPITPEEMRDAVILKLSLSPDSARSKPGDQPRK